MPLQLIPSNDIDNNNNNETMYELYIRKCACVYIYIYIYIYIFTRTCGQHVATCGNARALKTNYGNMQRICSPSVKTIYSIIIIIITTTSIIIIIIIYMSITIAIISTRGIITIIIMTIQIIITTIMIIMISSSTSTTCLSQPRSGKPATDKLNIIQLLRHRITHSGMIACSCHSLNDTLEAATCV